VLSLHDCSVRKSSSVNKNGITEMQVTRSAQTCVKTTSRLRQLCVSKILPDEFVSRTTECEDMPGMRGVILDLLAKTEDVVVDRSGFGR
jgi:hypothetical protein